MPLAPTLDNNKAFSSVPPVLEAASLLPATAQLVRRIGRKLVLAAFRRETRVERKADGSVVTATDRKAQDALRAGLAEVFPTAAFLGEEDAPHKLPAGFVWCVDPLDGTGNFAAGFPCFAVSVALLQDGTPTLGIVYDPVRDELFAAAEGTPLTCNDQPVQALAPAHSGDAVGFCDFKRLSRPHAEAMLAAQRQLRSLRNLGSCALEWAWLAAGRAHFVVHGGQALWDFAAGSYLAARAGALATDLAGKPLWPMHAPHKRSILAAASASLHATLRALLAR